MTSDHRERNIHNGALAPIGWRSYRPVLLLALTGLLSAAAQPVAAQSEVAHDLVVHSTDAPCRDACPDSDDQLWLVSTRSLGCAESGKQPKLQFWRRDDNDCWQASDQTAFLASDDPAMATRIWTHGHRIRYQESIHIGLLAHRGLAAAKSSRMRFVIWSWPSDQGRRGLRDVRAQARRTISESYYLASLIGQMNDDVAVHLIGYSFGARVVTGALHILGGGDLSGLRLAKTSTKKKGTRAVLFAAAINDDWLLSDGRHSRAMDAVEKLLATVNACDPILRWYHLLEKCDRPQALGREGQVNASTLGEKYHETDVTDDIGRIHDWRAYLRSATVMSHAREFFEITEQSDSEKSDSAK